MEKPILSPDFTIEDIHKLREYNYYLTKDMTPQERRDYYNKRGMEVHRQIQERKLQKAQHTENLTFWKSVKLVQSENRNVKLREAPTDELII